MLNFCLILFQSELKSGESVSIQISSSGCRGQKNEIRYLEHVQLVVDLSHSKRGDVIIDLTSPSGLTTRLLSERPGDQSTAGFMRWPFMSLHNWGEDPAGTWTVTVQDLVRNRFKLYLSPCTLLTLNLKAKQNIREMIIICLEQRWREFWESDAN